MKITDAQMDLLRLIGREAVNYWDAFNVWQVRRGIPCWLLRPARTFDALERKGLWVMDEHDRITLTDAGLNAIK
jgi:hypothetical protein